MLTANGTRILVDRLRPHGGEEIGCRHRPVDQGRGAERSVAQMVRRRFGSVAGFRRSYASELRDHSGELARLRARARRRALTPVFAARDELHNNAVVLRNVLPGRWTRAGVPMSLERLLHRARACTVCAVDLLLGARPVLQLASSAPAADREPGAGAQGPRDGRAVGRCQRQSPARLDGAQGPGGTNGGCSPRG
ncbi:DUF488 family protein [Reyranella sp.]|uniref:DUF488 family protein, N3 subclade n=1 Tax=Reyranella sp. TaxID=1929291 RepID=UPI003D0DC7B7